MRIKAGTLMKISDISALTLIQLTKKMLFSGEVTKCMVSISCVVKYVPNVFCASDIMRNAKTQKCLTWFSRIYNSGIRGIRMWYETQYMSELKQSKGRGNSYKILGMTKLWCRNGMINIIIRKELGGEPRENGWVYIDGIKVEWIIII